MTREQAADIIRKTLNQQTVLRSDWQAALGMALDALSAPLVPECEPDAWEHRWRHPMRDNGQWTAWTPGKGNFRVKDGEIERRALYAAPPTPEGE